MDVSLQQNTDKQGASPRYGAAQQGVLTAGNQKFPRCLTAKFIAFDTETTGLNSKENNILTACFIILDSNFNELDKLNLQFKYVNYNINIKALEINKIDILLHHNSDTSMYPDKARETFINFVKKYKIKKLIPIAHNLDFDLEFIKQFVSHDDLYNYLSKIESFDTLKFAKMLKCINYYSDKQSLKLSELCKLHEIGNLSEIHTAECDTRNCIELIRYYQNIFKLPLPDIYICTELKTKKRRKE